jgi:hypothetical protein
MWMERVLIGYGEWLVMEMGRGIRMKKREAVEFKKFASLMVKFWF